MPKTSFTIVMLIVAALAGGAVALADAGLPWRGELTRRAYAELLRGRLPMLACARHGTFPTGPGIVCDGLARDSTDGAVILVAGGRVRSVRRVWWRPAATGRAFVDSLVLAIAARSGGRLACATRRVPEGPRYDSLTVAWRPGASSALTATLRAASGVPHSAEGPEGWVVSVSEVEGPAPCGDP